VRLGTEQEESSMTIERAVFGKMPDGTPAQLYTLASPGGLEATISDYGGVVVSLAVPDRDGIPGDVVLGYDTLKGYLADRFYFGGIIGRFANRIAGGRFTLDGVDYSLAQNDGENHLHGGFRGFDKVVWQAEPHGGSGWPALRLTYVSTDGEEGYPGNLSVQVTYTVGGAYELRADYVASTDKPTVINLTNHSYFNLSGTADRDILDHVVVIDADRFTPAGPGLIPTGELAPVGGTPMDFRRPTAIGARIEQRYDQLLAGFGYDANYVLNRAGAAPTLAARVTDPVSGRALELLTTEPGLQFYSGNFLSEVSGKQGKVYRKRYGFCLEPQHFPDSPHQPEFPSVVLRPGQTYKQTSIYRFSVA
jgi:aldose 1-epimerase